MMINQTCEACNKKLNSLFWEAILNTNVKFKKMTCKKTNVEQSRADFCDPKFSAFLVVNQTCEARKNAENLGSRKSALLCSVGITRISEAAAFAENRKQL